MTPRPGETGAALLTVLLLVAVMAVIAATSLERLKLDTQLGIDAAATDQARAFAQAGETIARFRIGDLIQHDANRTTLDGDWAGHPTNFPVDGGLATARLDDGGNCFNLNSLVDRASEGTLVARPLGMVQFARLMTALDVPGRDALAISAAAADWIDSDDRPLPGGAEDAAYASTGQVGRTANTMMADVSELRAVAGVTPALYARLRPFICALPVSDASLINVNTLSPDQAPLLMMLLAGLDPSRARAAIALRPEHGFDSLAAFWNLPPMAMIGASDEGHQQVRATTRWFDLTLIVELQAAEFEEHALIDATQKPGKIARRSFGEPS